MEENKMSEIREGNNVKQTVDDFAYRLNNMPVEELRKLMDAKEEVEYQKSSAKFVVAYLAERTSVSLEKLIAFVNSLSREEQFSLDGFFKNLQWRDVEFERSSSELRAYKEMMNKNIRFEELSRPVSSYKAVNAR